MGKRQGRDASPSREAAVRPGCAGGRAQLGMERVHLQEPAGSVLRPTPAQNSPTEPTDLDLLLLKALHQGLSFETTREKQGLTFHSWVSLLATWSGCTLRAHQAWASPFSLHACGTWRRKTVCQMFCPLYKSPEPWCLVSKWPSTSRLPL